jgi:hypothetical protein
VTTEIYREHYASFTSQQSFMSSVTFPISPRKDLRGALAWLAFGALIVIMSWRMDRMESQGGTIYSSPGLLPGILGFALTLLAGLLVLRSLRRAREAGWNAGETNDTVLAPARYFRLAAGMFFIYSLLLIGRGLPFWLGTALFVTAYVFVFRRAERLADGTAGSTRGDAILAIICGVATAVVVTLLFEQLFYVRLP